MRLFTNHIRSLKRARSSISSVSSLSTASSSRPNIASIPSYHEFVNEDRERRLAANFEAAEKFNQSQSKNSSSINTTTLHTSNPMVDLCGRQHTYLRLSLTEKCNLRCRYCMPEDGIPLQPKEHMLTTDEIVEIGTQFNKWGVDKIRLTGGEPLVNKDIGLICREFGQLPNMKTLAITTNGLVLPKKLPTLLDAGVNLFNISLDTLIEDKFDYITRRKGYHRVMKSIDDLCEYYLESPTTRRMPKVNCVVTRGMNENEIVDFVELTRYKPIDVRFIELMPFNANSWDETKFVSYQEMLNTIDEHFNKLGDGSMLKLNDDKTSTTKAWKMNRFVGQVGFITSMTEPFCSGCNRIRVTADGDLKVCLFGDEKDGVSLRDGMRSSRYKIDPENTMNALVGVALRNKKPMLGGHKDMLDIARRSKYNRSMIRIGGYHTSARTDQSKKEPTCNGLTHLDETGSKPKMVDVGTKQTTLRKAHARTIIKLPKEVADRIVDENDRSGGGGGVRNDVVGPKGAVFTTAIIAGVQGAKKTSELIPFCHPLGLNVCDVNIIMLKNRNDDSASNNEDDGSAYVQIDCKVAVEGKTGVEMEALSGCSVAALTVYDMLKALSHDIIICETKLMAKSGGKRDFNR
jgi:molybdenum cofactor biosynthesis protein A/molybdenum cofactor biosynthesis protein MoaC